MTDDDLKDIILDLVNEIDYDIYKDLEPETAEDSEYAKERMDILVNMLRTRLEN